MDTLEAYLECNGNAQDASERLFIHRNTMRYRLDKIKHLLNMDLSDLDVCLRLKMALYIKNYLDSSEAEKIY